jgi:hypothetical protein
MGLSGGSVSWMHNLRNNTYSEKVLIINVRRIRMNASGFKNWLMSCGLKRSTAENRVANCATVERDQRIDLDMC